MSFVRPGELYSFEVHHVIRSRPIENCMSVGKYSKVHYYLNLLLLLLLLLSQRMLH